MLAGHLDILFCEVDAQVFGPFSNFCWCVVGSFYSLDQGSATMVCRPNSDCHLFVNKVLLGHSHVHLFMYCTYGFHHTVAKLSSCDRDRLVCKAQNTYHLAVRNIYQLPSLKLAVVWTANVSSSVVGLSAFLRCIFDKQNF